jgi:glutamate synthase (NADPH) small chain
MRMGRPQVVLACSSCFQTFKARLPEVELASLYTVLQEKGLPETAVIESTDAIAIHDPCTTRGKRPCKTACATSSGSWDMI